MAESRTDTQLSKTLDRGLIALEYVVAHPAGVHLVDVAEHLGVHRTIAHRLIRTLEAHHLVRRTSDRRVVPSGGLIPLADGVQRHLRRVAERRLRALTDRFSATAYLYLLVNETTVQAAVVTLPTDLEVYISIPLGFMQPVDRGAAGLAILAGRTAQEGEREAVTSARERGYATSFGEMIPNAHAISVAVPSGKQQPTMSVGLTAMEASRFEEFSAALREAADEIAHIFGDGR